MAKKDESAIRTRIAKFVRDEYGNAIVFSGSIKQAGGTPDLLTTLWGKQSGQWIHHAVEVKTETGEPSKRQVIVLQVMGRKGYVPMIVDNVRAFHEVHKMFDRLLAKHDDHNIALRQLGNHLDDDHNLWRNDN